MKLKYKTETRFSGLPISSGISLAKVSIFKWFKSAEIKYTLNDTSQYK